MRKAKQRIYSAIVVPKEVPAKDDGLSLVVRVTAGTAKEAKRRIERYMLPVRFTAGPLIEKIATVFQKDRKIA